MGSTKRPDKNTGDDMNYFAEMQKRKAAEREISRAARKEAYKAMRAGK